MSGCRKEKPSQWERLITIFLPSLTTMMIIIACFLFDLIFFKAKSRRERVWNVWVPHRKTKSMRTASCDFPSVFDNNEGNSSALLLFFKRKSETKSILYHCLMPFPLDAVLSRESINMSTNKQRKTKEEEEEDFDYCPFLFLFLFLAVNVTDKNNSYRFQFPSKTELPFLT